LADILGVVRADRPFSNLPLVGRSARNQFLHYRFRSLSTLRAGWGACASIGECIAR
jgi:hypothetical protein